MEKQLSTGSWSHSPTARTYDWLSHVYPLVDGLLMPSKKELIDFLNGLESSRIMDIGMGRAHYWDKLDRHTMEGMDISRKMRSYTQRKFLGAKIWSPEKLLEFPAKKNSYDIVLLSHVLSTWPKIDTLLLPSMALLKKDGLLVIQNYHAGSKGLSFLKTLNPLFKKCKFDSQFQIPEIDKNLGFKKIIEKKLSPWGIFQLRVYQKIG